jgi:hypothetical protein
VWKLKEPGMSMDPSEPEDGLEQLFAAEEAAIRDDGFSARVVERAGRSERGISLRRTAIYGSALVGAGFAVGGIVEMAPHLPDMTGWWSSAGSAVASVSSNAAQGGADPAVLVIAAVVAGVTFLVAAVSMQSR